MKKLGKIIIHIQNDSELAGLKRCLKNYRVDISISSFFSSFDTLRVNGDREEWGCLTIERYKRSSRWGRDNYEYLSYNEFMNKYDPTKKPVHSKIRKLILN